MQAGRTAVDHAKKDGWIKDLLVGAVSAHKLAVIAGAEAAMKV
jgi:hypothetical protein